MFDKELFLSICEKYVVEFNDKHDKPMIRIDGELKEIDEKVFNDIMKIYST